MAEYTSHGGDTAKSMLEEAKLNAKQEYEQTYNHCKSIGFKCGSDYVLDGNNDLNANLTYLDIQRGTAAEAGFIAGWNEATNTFITEGTYSIFKNAKGYVYLRKIDLAYGNTATVIEYTANVQDANLFRKDITKLNPEDYYHEFRNVLELEIQHLEHYHINIKTTKQYTFSYEDIMPSNIIFFSMPLFPEGIKLVVEASHPTQRCDIPDEYTEFKAHEGSRIDWQPDDHIIVVTDCIWTRYRVIA